MTDRTVTLPGGSFEVVRLPPNFSEAHRELVAGYYQQISEIRWSAMIQSRTLLDKITAIENLYPPRHVIMSKIDGTESKQ
jgi:hypothetical protein